MKAVKIIVIIILTLFVVVFAGAFIFLKTFDINKYLPQIEQIASTALARPVSIAHADLNLSLQGLTLDVGKVTVADDAQFSSEPLMAMNGVHLGVQLLPLILERKIQVTAIVLKSPQIHMVRNKAGVINVQTIGQAPIKEGTTPAPAAQPAETKTPAANPLAALPVLSIKSITVEHASVVFVDNNEQMPLHINVPDINVKVDNFSLTEKFPVAVDAIVYSAAPDLHIDVQVAIDAAKLSVTATNLSAKLDLAKINLDQVKTVTPMLSQIPMPQQIAGELGVHVDKIVAGASGLTGLQADVTLSNGNVKLKELLSPVSDITAKATVGLSDAALDQFSLKIASGSVTGQADIKDYLKAQTFTGKVTMADIKVQELIDSKLMPVDLQGKINGKINISGIGFTMPALTTSLKGTGSVSLAEGVINHLNVMKMVLGNTLNVIPGLADQVDTLLTGVLKDKLGGDNTVLDKAEATFSIANGVVDIEEAIAQTKTFDITAKGTMDFQLKADIQTMFHLTPEASASVAAQVKELGYLMDDNKQIAVGATISGVVPNLKYKPNVDLKKIGTNALIEAGGNQLQKVIEKNPQVGDLLNSILGGSKANTTQPTTTDAVNPAPDQPTDPATDQQPTKEEKREKNKALINNVLNSFLK